MVLLHCRECGAEIQSDTKNTKCPKCNTLFPFACAVCNKLLRPPIPDYPIERYFTQDGKPLCEDHYQRQCPECQKWFQADENPGYFLCKECSSKRGQEVAATASTTSSTSLDDDSLIPAISSEGARTTKSKPAVDTDEDSPRAAARGGKKGCGAGMLCVLGFIAVTCLSWHLLNVPAIIFGR